MPTPWTPPLASLCSRGEKARGWSAPWWRRDGFLFFGLDNGVHRRLFDRRCRTDTALEKLARLRRRVRRYRGLGKSLDKLHSPNLEKALTFLDDELMPATSNAVERGNRRHRKMQKAVYRVRTRGTLMGRMALDLERDQQGEGRADTITCLHKGRAKP